MPEGVSAHGVFNYCYKDLEIGKVRTTGVSLVLPGGL